jgi:hypothetical protein
MPTETEKFKELIKANAVFWSAYSAQMPRPGLRVCYISGGLIRELIASCRVAELWQQTLNQLPDDVVVLDIGYSFLFPVYTPHAMFDKWGIIFCSNTWPPLPDGADIPELDLKFIREWACPNHLTPHINPGSVDKCGVCGRKRCGS